jgi:gliding motility-associated-like protein
MNMIWMRIILITFFLFNTGIADAQIAQNEAQQYRIVARNAAFPEIESVSNVVDIYLPMRIYLPSAFTPNGDGLNDTFGAVGEGIEVYQLKIYNRWGQIIFSSKNVDYKWDGLHNGRQVPQGEYSYELLAYGKEFGEIFTSGTVMVID